MYAGELGQQFSGVTPDAQNASNEDERVYKTSEGPVLISTQNNFVFLSESFPLPLAHQLQFLMVGAQGDEDNSATARAQPTQSLTDGLVHFFQSCGMMRAALHLY